MIKFGTIGTFKQARNVGNVATTIDLKNGQLVTYDRINGTIALPTTTTAKKSLWIVMNEREAIEYVGQTDDYVIKAGDYPRMFDLATLSGAEIDMNDLMVTGYSTLQKGDTLVADTNGKFVKSTDATGYDISFTVKELTGFGGNGLRVIVNA